MKFSILKKDIDTEARIGKISTHHGEFETPIFMPVATSAAIKGIHNKDLKESISPDVILSNTYHLYLRPGKEIIENAGGLHQFMKWDKSILTDSGGYQVYSLSNNRKINYDGVKFKSHIDGSYHFFTPEKSIDIQRSIGADIIMAFDECTPFPCEKIYARKSMELTHNWLDRCIKRFNSTKSKYLHNQVLFPIVQGGMYKDLRKISAEHISSMDFDGNAIGGLSVGEPHDIMYEISEIVCEILPERKPRYLMGVGTPLNIIENISLGIDMFDCVMPTRNARNGMLFTSEGTINIKNKKWENDHSAIDLNGNTFVDNLYSKAYLRHLFSINENLGKQIATIHNLGFYKWIIETTKNKIREGKFLSWKKNMTKKLDIRL
ncbi:MAG: tRNA guanosine(34) transglycosylase Tgt [Bacteroidota bacterium]|nr:tRNA guanosine(34) transglycosylase Tgt [Bacteroidota bacterium]MEC8601575.1 tRNA guanosine(34) transglycosylase Tgt [Bacteroidota bacterium]|tara:strand:+ start:2849 stop:3979 length:1131 start_codon:yes stop_codon:yes gene_type:complete